MFSKIVVCLVASFCAVSGQNLTDLRSRSWPFDLCTPFPFPTLSPINIDTSETNVVPTLTPLKVTLGDCEPHNISNTGHSVQVTVNHPVLTSVTGGVLGAGVYIFQDLTFYWTGDYRSDASTLIDGVGTPIHVRAVFRNTKYPTPFIAGANRDGFAILATNILVGGYCPNKAFIPFEGVLRQIVPSGAITIADTRTIFSWFEQIPLIDHYYAYPGSDIQLNGFPNQCYSATVIQFPRAAAPYISIPQFQAFLNLLNPGGTPITNVLPTHPRLCRPVVEACGVEQVNVPTVA